MRLPDFGGTDASRRFSADLYLEHLEEASFLYEQRRGLYDDPEVPWLGIGAFEERLDAHLDALVSGGEAAREICERQAKEGEPGELYAAVCVFCREERRDLLGLVLKALESDNPARSQAVSDAMKDEMPAEWAEPLAVSVSRGFERLAPIVAQYLGYRRLPVTDVFDVIADRLAGHALAHVVWAAGRANRDSVVPAIASYLGHESPAVRANAVTALLRRGDEQAVAACRRRAAQGDAAMYLPLAVCGDKTDSAFLREAATGTARRDAVIALGLLGDPGAVRMLVDTLSDEQLAGAAATALQLVTGADLREDAFIPESVDEDELFDDERELYQQTGLGPQHPDGRPYGVSVKRVSRSPDRWREWLSQHKDRFAPGHRYRLGKPFSPEATVDTLVSGAFTRQVRGWAYEELAIRYQIDGTFETDMRVIQQKKQINAIARMCRSLSDTFQPGRWFFARRAV